MRKTAAKKKGLSIEEKVFKVENWFHQHPQPYTLKELIAHVPRATGVIFQSIEECVELLVSEGRVCQDKVGVHTLFWWFPTTATQREWQASADRRSGQALTQQQTQRRAVEKVAEARACLQSLPTDELERTLAVTQKEAERLNIALASQQHALGTEEARQHDAARQRALLHDCHAQRQKLKALALYDNHFIDAVRHGTTTALEAANRWTDNFFLLEQHVISSMGRSARELRGSLHVPEELDFISTVDISGGGEPLAPAPVREAPPSNACEVSRRDATVHKEIQDGVAATPVTLAPASASPTEKARHPRETTERETARWTADTHDSAAALPDSVSTRTPPSPATTEPTKRRGGVTAKKRGRTTTALPSVEEAAAAVCLAEDKVDKAAGVCVETEVKRTTDSTRKRKRAKV